MDDLLDNTKKDINKAFLWPSLLNKEIIFPENNFESLLRELGFEFNDWFNYWQKQGGDKLALSYWSSSTKKDWIWGLGFPFLTEIKRFISKKEELILLGISALPGCGKSSLGKWLEASTKELNWPVNVISLDDFYLPGKELDHAMFGNPWDVPRGLPGSHSIDLLQETLEKWRATGILKAPQFDKALRNGLGDRSGWKISNPRVLVIEGWFLGCSPMTKSINQNAALDKLEPYLSNIESSYREKVQKSLKEYLPIWDQILRLWHIKPIDFHSTSKWKIEQENEMYKLRGSSLRGKSLASFVRMIQAAIPQYSLMNLESNVVVKINQSRKILWVGNKEDEINF